MPSDIRSFFGGKPAATAAAPAAKKSEKPAAKKVRGSRKVIDDSDEEEEPAPKPKTTAPKQLKREPSPEGEATTTADYFATSKPKRSEPSRPSTRGKATPQGSSKSTPVKANGKATPAAQTPTKKSTPSTRGSARKTAPKSYAENLNEEDFLDDDEDTEDVFKAEVARNGKGLDDYKEDEDELEVEQPVVPQRSSNGPGKQKKLKEDEYEPDEDVDMKDEDPEDDFVVPDDDEMIIEDKPATKTKTKAKAGTKRKTKEVEDEDEDDSDEAPKKKAKKAPAPKKAKKEGFQDSAEIRAILDSIPTITPPSPPPADGEGKSKWVFGGGHANSGPAPEADPALIPEGAENCLAGLSFVFTGLLTQLNRDDGQALVKRYGGKVVGAPSKKTSYIVLGTEAGPKKLENIKKFGLKTIDEHGLFDLIRKLPANGGSSKAASENAEKQKKEEDKVREMAEEMEKQERKDRKVAQAKAAGNASGSKAPAASSAKGKENVPDNRLWTVKYAPQQMSQICGNKGQVEKLQRWLKEFPKNQKKGFKHPGPDGSGTYRAVMIHGPPGIGKTTSAHLVAKLEGYDIVESNASDTRSKKLVEQGLRGVLSTNSLLGYFSSGGKDIEQSKKKLVLIMDEVDGMSAGDRGGVGALASVCRKSEVPMILICNERKQPKMKPFDHTTFELGFRRPTAEMIRSRLMTIMFREGMKMPPQVIDALIAGTGADIRQVVNMISTAKLDDMTTMDFDESKKMSKAWEKHIILKPWDIVSKILGGGMFAASSNATLNEKIELYFNDHEFSYLMLQENYLGTSPILAHGQKTPQLAKLKALELASKAADSISDGDLVDRMIHGSQQQWSLMPAHAVFSFVRPASYMSGSQAGNQTRFTSWLGKNSAQGKLTRMIKDIQGHMRLRTSGDRHEIRQQYVPILWQSLIKKLENEGKDSIEDVIELMDSYFLTKDDFDAIQELGVGPMDMERVKIDTQTKTAFTRKYNLMSHPLPFMKASNVLQPKKLSREKPDLEEAIEESDEGEVLEVKEENAEEEDMDLSKDKYVKQPKKKKAAAAPKAGAKGKGKKKKAEDDDDEDDEDEEEEVKPKKGKGKAAAKGKGKK